MGTFELNNESAVSPITGVGSRRLRDECIIALKVYDQCRQLHCKIHLVRVHTISKLKHGNSMNRLHTLPKGNFA